MSKAAGQGKAVLYSTNPLESGRLRLALFEAWDGRCSWCRQTLRDVTFMEIDHILPQKGFAAACKEFGKPSTFVVHQVENLAPICAAGRRCNVEKSNAVLSAAGAIYRMLERAEKTANRVRRNVEEMRSAQGHEKVILRLLSAPLDDPTVIKALSRHGGLLAQRLHAADPTLVGHYLSARRLAPRIEANPTPDHVLGPDPDDDVLLTLDSEGRAAYTVAQTVLGQDLDDVLTEGIEQVFADLSEEIRNKGLDYDDSDGGFVLAGMRRLELDDLTFTLEENELLFTLKGRVSSMHAASVVTFDDFGERQDVQRDVAVEGAFAINARAWLPFDEFALDVDLDEMRVERV